MEMNEASSNVDRRNEPSKNLTPGEETIPENQPEFKQERPAQRMPVLKTTWNKIVELL